MSSIKLFQSNQIRSACNEDEQQWYFSIVDVVGALSESSPSPHPKQNHSNNGLLRLVATA